MLSREKVYVKVSEMFDQAVENYVRFLSGISKKGKRIIVINTPLPTIEDDNA